MSTEEKNAQGVGWREYWNKKIVCIDTEIIKDCIQEQHLGLQTVIQE